MCVFFNMSVNNYQTPAALCLLSEYACHPETAQSGLDHTPAPATPHRLRTSVMQLLINLLFYSFVFLWVCLDCKLGTSIQNCVCLSVCQQRVGADGYVNVLVLIVPHVHS